MQQKKINSENFNGGITAPKGFLVSGIHCGIKKVKRDLAIILSNTPATAAGVFTLNKVQAAPVLVCKEHLNKSKTFRAIVVNSGNANACTGQRGYDNAVIMANETANELNIKPEEVFVSSTGVIGEQLPMDKIVSGIKKAVKHLGASEHENAAKAIMTTDTFAKSASVVFMIDGKNVIIGGISKGSGMIHHNMATMLAFVTTDAAIEQDVFQALLKNVVDKTFNKMWRLRKPQLG